MREWLRVRRLNRLVDFGLEYGVAVYYKKESDSDVWASWPDEPEEKTTEQRHDAAQKTIESLWNQSPAKVHRAYRWGRQVIRRYAVKETLSARVNDSIVATFRTEIMVELYRSGREDHPLYTSIAATASMSELKVLKKEVASLKQVR